MKILPVGSFSNSSVATIKQKGIARPLATPAPGAFLGGLRVMAVDGTVWDVPDSTANAKEFEPASRKGNRAR